MATKAGPANIWMTPLDWPTPKTPTQMQNSGICHKWELSYCDFVWKFQHFRYHGNMGWFDTNLTYTVKSAVPENPYLAQESWWYLIHKLSYDFLMKFTDFCNHGNKGWSSKNLNDSIGLAEAENLHTDAKFWDLS